MYLVSWNLVPQVSEFDNHEISYIIVIKIYYIYLIIDSLI